MYTHEPKLLTIQNSAMKIIKVNTNEYELTERQSNKKNWKSRNIFFQLFDQEMQRRVFT